jgi:acylphosphatase
MVGGPVVRRRVIVAGRVQGVFFRDSARRRAESLGVSGHARNRSDGRVELEFEGEASAVDELVAWSRRGPSRADVAAVEVEEVAPTGSSGFRIS